MSTQALELAVIGAGPVGLALALHAARVLPQARISLFDRRTLDDDVGRDPRTLALSLGSVQLLQRLQVWPEGTAQPITEVHVSQLAPTLAAAGPLGAPEVRILAGEEGVPMLGAVLRYGELLAPMQQAWLQAAQREPQRLITRFGSSVAALKPLPGAVELDSGIAERFDLGVVAEGGVFAQQARKALARDYGQTAWVGTATLDGGAGGLAVERFTRHGPLALLPLRAEGLPPGQRQAALVWCVNRDDDPVRTLDDVQRQAVLNMIADPQRTIEQEVEAALLLQLPAGAASLPATARALGLHPRTLQRRLEAAGVPFGELLDRVRRQQAARHLANPRLRLTDVAELTGYASLSAFTRWYSVAHGQSPSLARQRSGTAR